MILHIVMRMHQQLHHHAYIRKQTKREEQNRVEREKSDSLIEYIRDNTNDAKLFSSKLTTIDLLRRRML